MNAKPNEWNLIYLQDFAIFDLVNVSDLGKVAVKFIIIYSGRDKVELIEKLANEVNRLLMIENFHLVLKNIEHYKAEE